jgi:hypothetical protein
MKWRSNFDYFSEEGKDGFEPRKKNKVKKMKNGKLDRKPRGRNDAKHGEGNQF